MQIFYLTVDRYSQFMPNVPPGEKNPGGGISGKTIGVVEAWRREYDVEVSENIDQCDRADVLVVEPLWFRLRGGLLEQLKAPNLLTAIKDYEDHPAKTKVVYLSEFAFDKFPLDCRNRIIEASTVVTSNCPYQKSYFNMKGIETVHLPDPVSESVFYTPRPKKELSVCGTGRISVQKNSQKLVRIFRALERYPIKRVYVGDAALWGFASEADLWIEDEMRTVVDEFYVSQAQIPLRNILERQSCIILDTFHDSCSSSNIEAMMAGVLCLYGLHGAWKDRPGISGLDEVEDFVAAIAKATTEFTAIPSTRWVEKSQEWVMARYSFVQFLKDWRELLRYVGAV